MAYPAASPCTVKPEAAPVAGCRTEGRKKLKFKKMKTLEELLQGLGCVGDAFDSTGEFTEAGDKAYRFLLDLLYDIEGLTGESVSSIVKELDGICNENYKKSKLWTEIFRNRKSTDSQRSGRWR